MNAYFKTENLSVGYNKKVLIRDINISLEKGKILTLIGPNGSGKSTILKSISRQIPLIGGRVCIDGRDISRWDLKTMAKTVSVMLTDRIRTDMMTCFEVVSMGRYPYTNVVGRLTDEDKEIVVSSLESVGMTSHANQDFNTLSDGQKQRILLARAICQEPEVIILDEPTAYLDVKHKIELLDTLSEMARAKNVTVIMSLHEIDLAAKISDYLLCVKGDTIQAFGTPEEILRENTIENLYNMEKGSYNLNFGSVELAKPEGEPKVFVVGGAGRGIPYYRALQKEQIPFAAGIIFENDIDFQVASKLSDHVISAPAFEPVSEELFNTASDQLLKCRVVIDAGGSGGTFNHYNRKLLELAEQNNIPISRKEKENSL
ncbi:MAG: ABC transporter ATP-binding protein [Firmicutes bacterium]|nr:ABC transporter ATP-binding protein [Bacillota bacterium]